MTTQAQTPLWQTSHKIVLGGLVLAQLVAAYVVGAGHWLTNDGLYVLPPIGITATLPVVLFLAAYALSTRFRSFVLAQDLRTLTRLQHWRVVGFMFLALYAFDQLPAVFAWPAGIGDVAVGLTAAVVVTKMERDPHYATTPGFRWFHIAGLTDFAVAIVTSGLAAGAFPALIAGGITTAPMDVWPLNIFPSFIVPAFIILQLAALFGARELRRSRDIGTAAALQAA